MLEAMSALFLSSPGGILGAFGVLGLLALGLDRNYWFVRPISDKFIKRGEPFTQLLLMTLAAAVGLWPCINVILSPESGEAVKSAAVTAVATITGAYIGQLGKAGRPYRKDENASEK